MLKYRLVSFVALLGLFALITFGGKVGIWLFLAGLTLGIFAVTCELSDMFKNIELPTYKWMSAVLTALLFHFGSNLYNPSKGILIFEFMALVVYAGIFLIFLGTLFAKDKALFIKKAVGSLGLVLMVSIPFAFCSIIYLNQTLIFGAKYFMFMVLVTKSMDTGGYIAGMLTNKYMKNGNHKMVPAISPNKSWEGTLGGILLALIVAFIFYQLEFIKVPFRHEFPAYVYGKTLGWYMITALVLAAGSLAGDLTESAIKRCCKVKDSGRILPGMGGVFDLFDSFIYNGVLFIIMLKIMK